MTLATWYYLDAGRRNAIIHQLGLSCFGSATQYRLRQERSRAKQTRHGQRSVGCGDRCYPNKIEPFTDAIPDGTDEVDRGLFNYIEIFYNRIRLHSTLGYITPAERAMQALEESFAA